ncbi:MAG: hypothetical protein FWF90_17810 [Promicromonosporaceae bacterium]|nr:hypothetical protein [Promicromonosporaceae bacterium]
MIRHEARERPAPVPITLPLVEVTIPDVGPISVAVDGVALEPSTPLDRSTLRAQIIELARVRDTALRVRVTESGRPPFTDIVTPDDPDTHPGSSTVVPARVDLEPATRVAPAPFLVDDVDGVVVGLAGDGFLPGEHVAFAVIVTRNQADDDGTASARLPTALLQGRPGPFVLFGQTSGTLVLADPFGGDQR